MDLSGTSLKHDVKEALQRALTRKEATVIESTFGLNNGSSYRTYEAVSIDNFDECLSGYLMDKGVSTALRKLRQM